MEKLIQISDRKLWPHLKRLFCCVFLLTGLYTASMAQTSDYEGGTFGKIYNPTLKKTFAATRYNNWARFRTTGYLPYLPTEWDPASGSDPDKICNKAIALYVKKSEKDSIYASAEVIGMDNNNMIIPFIDYVAHTDVEFQYIAKFEDFILPFPFSPMSNPFDSKDAVLVMEATQKFNQFTFDMFGWKGIDKDGTLLIKSLLKKTGTTTYDPVTKILSYKVPNLAEELSYASRDMVGHQMCHAILDHKHGSNSGTSEYKEMLEGFANVISAGFVNFQKVPFKPISYFDPVWHFPQFAGLETASDNFRDPKSKDKPTTLKGINYKTPGTPDYDHHINGAVLSHCFFIMVNGKRGYVDDDPTKEYYRVLPLDLYDKKTAWSIGLKLFFTTFTEKLNQSSGFGDARQRMLETAEDMGYPKGSHVYVQIMNAWHAVGVGTLWEPGIYNPSCAEGQNRIAESLYDGPVPINTVRVTVTDKLQSGSMYLLEDCVQLPQIRTRPYYKPSTVSYNDTIFNYVNGEKVFDSINEIIAVDYNKIYAIDADDDNVYTLDNNLKQSKSLVSIHWATKQALSYFQWRYNYSGMDGTGTIAIKNRVAGEFAPTNGFNPADTTVYYSQGDGRMDHITSNYVNGIYHFRLGYAENKYVNPESPGIKIALADILALGVKNKYLTDKGEPATWKLHQTSSEWSFATPNDAGKAIYYKGYLYEAADPASVSGVMDYWYYLLVNGTDSQYPNGWPNETGELCTVFGIDKTLAEKIVFYALTKFLTPYPTFEDMRLATQKAVIDELGFAQNSPTYIAVTDAWHAVGVGPAYNTLLAHSPENGATGVYMMPIDLGIETEYPQFEDTRLFELSTSPYFDDNVATVYRAVSYKVDKLLPFQDENNPGKTVTHARFFMEPNTKYHWRSRLLTVSTTECPPELDPTSFCNLLKIKKKWSPTYWFTTGPFTAETFTPKDKQANVHPWPQQFTFKTNPGVIKSEIQVIEEAFPNNIMEIAHSPDVFDAATPQIDSSEVFKVMTAHQWRVRDIGQMKGSPEGLDANLNHIGQTGPEIITDWSNNGKWISYTTGKPQGNASAPVDKITVPPFGKDIEFTWLPVKGAAGHKLQFSLSDQFDAILKSYDVADGAILSKTLNQMPSFKDKEVIYWRIVPIGPKGTFVPVGEEGSPSAVRSIMIDHNLIPAVVLTGPEDVVPVRFGANFTWDAVAGAQNYEFNVARTMDQIVPANGAGSTPNTSIILTDLDILPPGITGGYTWSVRAGAKDPQTQQMVFGKWAAPLTYKLRPDKVLSIKPVEESDVDPPEQKADLTFTAKQNIEWAPSGYKFQLEEEGSVVFEKLLPTLESVKLYQLHCNTGYKYTFAALNDDISSVTTWKEFLTLGGNACSDEGKPDKPTETPPVGNGSGLTSLGFSLDLFDFEFPNATTFQAKVTVIAPDGTLAYEFDNIFSNGSGVMFIPDANAQFSANGNLPEMNGVYKMTIEITKLLNGADENFAADVKFKLIVFEYDNNTLEIIKAIPHEAPLGGRAVGMSIDDLEIPYVIPN
ncbi:M4 family metallopeptidase [Dyadobacter bucti]|uniref:M4 family metallopeptidase n=1 Tax=Dyadobacter bucti TaxID=2572203 RepID=UPI003F714CA1